MKQLSAFAMFVIFLVSAPLAHAGYFYVTKKLVRGNESLSTSLAYSTLAACETKSQNVSSLVQDCVATCDPANLKSEYFLEQVTNGSYQGFGPYGYQADCEAGIQDAAAAGMTNVMTTCTFVVAKTKCK